jgi:hypothetical protein
VNSHALILALVLTILFSPAICRGQWFDYIQTESDWDDFYYRDYFDYSSYQLYRELAENYTVKDTLDYLMSVLGNSPIEFGWRMNTAELRTVESPDLNPELLHTGFKSGHRIHADDNSSYYYLKGIRKDVSVTYKARNELNSWNTVMRALTWNSGHFRVALGNYTNDIGLGLGIGRFEYQPISMSPDSAGNHNDFLFPANSYFNGLKLDFRKSSILYSTKRYGVLRKDFVGGWSSLLFREYDIGLAVSAVRLKSGGFERTMGSGSVFASNFSLGLKMELAYAESGAGAALRIQRQNHEVSIWHYEKSFTNLQSSGIAHHDYVAYSESHLEATFRQPQSGETGVLVRNRLGISSLRIESASEIWKRSPGSGISADYSLGTSYEIAKFCSFKARFSERFGEVENRLLAECGADYYGNIRLLTRSSFWFDSNKVAKSRSFCYVSCSAPISRVVNISGRVRSYFDGDWDYFVEESIIPLENLRLKITYRWKQAYHDDLGPLFILMEAAI